MTEYIDKMETLNKLQGRKTIELVRDIKPANVIERSKIDKTIEEIKALSNKNPSYWATCDVVDREDVLEILRNIGE